MVLVADDDEGAEAVVTVAEVLAVGANDKAGGDIANDIIGTGTGVEMMVWNVPLVTLVGKSLEIGAAAVIDTVEVEGVEAVLAVGAEDKAGVTGAAAAVKGAGMVRVAPPK